jgi:hypothetical protein
MPRRPNPEKLAPEVLALGTEGDGPRTSTVPIRLTTEEHRALRMVCAARGTTMSAVARMLMMDFCRRHARQLQEVVAEIAPASIIPIAAPAMHEGVGPQPAHLTPIPFAPEPPAPPLPLVPPWAMPAAPPRPSTPAALAAPVSDFEQFMAATLAKSHSVPAGAPLGFTPMPMPPQPDDD